jgi:hypothetical protein
LAKQEPNRNFEEKEGEEITSSKQSGTKHRRNEARGNCRGGSGATDFSRSLKNSDIIQELRKLVAAFASERANSTETMRPDPRARPRLGKTTKA